MDWEKEKEKEKEAREEDNHKGWDQEDNSLKGWFLNQTLHKNNH